MRDIRIVDSAMKTPGFIETQMVKCGRKGCKCNKGQLHGPYFYYRYWKLYHKTWLQQKKYVNKTEAEKIAKAINKYKETLSWAGENPYRALRRNVRSNIKHGVANMTQRKLASISAKMNAFVE